MSQGLCADDLYKGIQSSVLDERCESLKQLAVISKDVTFAQEFISRDGHSLLVQIVEDDKECVFIFVNFDWMCRDSIDSLNLM